MPSFGNLFASLTLESVSFMSGLKAADKELRATQKTFANVGKQMQNVGAVMTVAVTAPFVALVSNAIPAAVESQQAMAQVNAALASMGPAAGRTSEQLVGLAGKLQDISVFDDDEILKSVTANLLTFGNVSGAAFDRAQLAAVNLSARMGTDLQSAALMVGKALNDPIKGLASLGRAGIQFSTDQKDAIKAMVAGGNAAGAQAIMLGELEKQFGGAAAAQRGATPTAEMDQAWRTFQETVGGAALQVLPSITNALTGLLNAFNQLSPGMQTFVIGGAAVAAALGPVVAGIGGLVTIVGAALPVLAPLTAGVLGLAVAEGTAATASYAFGAALLPILGPIALVTAAVGAVVLAVRNWDKIQPYVDKVVGWMGALYTGVKTWIVDRLAGVWKSVTDKVAVVKQAFFGLYDAVVGHSYIPDMVNGIAEHMARLDGVMVRVAQGATGKTGQAFDELRGEIAASLDRLFPEQAQARRLEREWANFDKALAAKTINKDTWAAARRRLEAEMQAMSDAANPFAVVEPKIDVAAQVLAGFRKAANDNADTQRRTTADIARSYSHMARDVAASVRGVVDAIRGGDFFDVLTAVAQAVAAVLGGLGNIKGGGSSGSFGGARAMGGPVLPNRSYLVGENGPEMFSPGRAGSIVPNDMLGARPSGPINIDLRGAVMTQDLLNQMQVIANDTSGQVLGRYAASQSRRGARTLGG